MDSIFTLKVTKKRSLCHQKKVEAAHITLKAVLTLKDDAYSSEVIINLAYIMFENTCCKLSIGIDLISYRWFNFENILVFYAANNVAMIHRFSVTKYRDAQIYFVSIVQVFALQIYVSIFIRNKRGSFKKKQWYCCTGSFNVMKFLRNQL